MREILQYLLDNCDSIILAIAVILSNLLGKPKTAEQLEKQKEKLKIKLAKKGEKQLSALKATTEKMQEIQKKED